MTVLAFFLCRQWLDSVKSAARLLFRMSLDSSLYPGMSFKVLHLGQECPGRNVLRWASFRSMWRCHVLLMVRLTLTSQLRWRLYLRSEVTLFSFVHNRNLEGDLWGCVSILFLLNFCPLHFGTPWWALPGAAITPGVHDNFSFCLYLVALLNTAPSTFLFWDHLLWHQVHFFNHSLKSH